MKLRNKKTGEIGYFCFANWNDPVLIIMDKNGIQLAKYNSLTELNSEWEDAPEEPKEYWYIDYDGGIFRGISDNSSTEKMMISMGNHFESLEEAEKAVEKLKAWKRLKDKGFRLERWCFSSPKEEAKIIIKGNCVPDTVEELDLLFESEDNVESA